MRYNKAFKKVSPKPTKKLEKPAQIVTPTFLPSKLADFEKRLTQLQKNLDANKKKFSEVDKKFSRLLDFHTFEDNKIDSAFRNAKAAIESYEADRVKLYKQCVETAAVCSQAKIGIEMANTELKKARTVFVAAEKKFDAWQDGKYDYDGGKTFKAVVKQINSSHKEVLDAKKMVDNAKAEIKAMKKLMP